MSIRKSRESESSQDVRAKYMIKDMLRYSEKGSRPPDMEQCRKHQQKLNEIYQVLKMENQAHEADNKQNLIKKKTIMNKVLSRLMKRKKKKYDESETAFTIDGEQIQESIESDENEVDYQYFQFGEVQNQLNKIPTQIEMEENTQETASPQKKFSLVAMRKRDQTNEPRKSVRSKEKDPSQEFVVSHIEERPQQQILGDDDVPNLTDLSIESGHRHCRKIQEQVQEFLKQEESEQRLQLFEKSINLQAQALPDTSLSHNTDESPYLELDFLNDQEQEAIQNLKTKKTPSGSAQSLLNSSLMAPSFFEKLFCNCQGTTLSIVGVKSAKQVTQVKDYLKYHDINPTRTIPILDEQEAVFHMSTVDDVTYASNLIQGKKIPSVKFQSNTVKNIWSSELNSQIESSKSKPLFFNMPLSNDDYSYPKPSSQLNEIFDFKKGDQIIIQQNEFKVPLPSSVNIPNNYLIKPRKDIQPAESECSVYSKPGDGISTVFQHVASNQANFPINVPQTHYGQVYNIPQESVQINQPLMSADNMHSQHFQQSDSQSEYFSYIPPFNSQSMTVTFDQLQQYLFSQQQLQMQLNSMKYYVPQTIEQIPRPPQVIIPQNQPWVAQSTVVPTSETSPTSTSPEPKKKKKKKCVQHQLVNNQIELHRILFQADSEVMNLTTLMIRNIPINNFTQSDMIALIDVEFKGYYNYFYQPKDLKTQQGVGFAFINMVHPVYIIEFYLKFNGIKWCEKIAKSNSTKLCEITYANVQGLEEIKLELQDKKAMKKQDLCNKPVFFEELQVDQELVNGTIWKYKNDPMSIHFMNQKLLEFQNLQKLIQEQKEQNAKALELQKLQKLQKEKKKLEGIPFYPQSTAESSYISRPNDKKNSPIGSKKAEEPPKKSHRTIQMLFSAPFVSIDESNGQRFLHFPTTSILRFRPDVINTQKMIQQQINNMNMKQMEKIQRNLEPTWDRKIMNAFNRLQPRPTDLCPKINHIEDYVFQDGLLKNLNLNTFKQDQQKQLFQFEKLYKKEIMDQIKKQPFLCHPLLRGVKNFN